MAAAEFFDMSGDSLSTHEESFFLLLYLRRSAAGPSNNSKNTNNTSVVLQVIRVIRRGGGGQKVWRPFPLDRAPPAFSAWLVETIGFSEVVNG